MSGDGDGGLVKAVASGLICAAVAMSGPGELRWSKDTISPCGNQPAQTGSLHPYQGPFVSHWTRLTLFWLDPFVPPVPS